MTRLPVGAALPGWVARPFPPLAPMAGRYCRLEPLDAAAHAQELWEANEADEDGDGWVYMPYGPFGSVADYSAWVEAMSRRDDPQFFAILSGDGPAETWKPSGVASYLRVFPEIGSIEVGHIRFAPRLQRTRAATEAMHLMMTRAFDELGYRRYEWKCDALNAASRRAAERLGFTFEGVFRQATMYKGRNRDTAWYSITDAEWPSHRARLEAWLDPANFTADGVQLTNLGSRSGGGPSRP